MLKLKRYEVTDFELRKFAGIFIVLSVLFTSYSYWNTKTLPKWSVALASVLAFTVIFKPKLLTFWYNLWMGLSYGLGYLNTYLILFIMFFLVLSPIGLFRRLIGKNGLQTRRSQYEDSFAIPSKGRSINHFNRMF